MNALEKIENTINFFIPGHDVRSNWLRCKVEQKLIRHDLPYERYTPEDMNALVLETIDLIA